MRLGLLILLLIATLFGSSFWYTHIDAVCKVPLAYRIGTIDSRFGTSEEEVKRIAGQAEKIWEDNLSRDLFVYDESAELQINFVFDERQENAEREEELRQDLEAKEGMSESVAAQYEKLVAEFRALKKQYENRVISYESSLKAYNTEVNDWNEKGGAPEEELAELKKSEQSLKAEQSALEDMAEKLNRIVGELNRIGARGNTLIKDYNSIVEEYNSEFTEVHEFTQGDYLAGVITVYQFNSEDELAVVLAHEFGHALSLDHVENERSIMYRTMEVQSVIDGISSEDKAEFERVCADQSFIIQMLRFLKSLV